MSKPAVAPPEVGALVAERYGFPIVGGRQARLIASLHALINWLLEHPDIPMPHYMELRAHPVMTGVEITPADLIDLANTLDGRVQALERGGSAMTATVLPTGEDTCRIDYTVFSGKPNTGPLT